MKQSNDNPFFYGVTIPGKIGNSPLPIVLSKERYYKSVSEFDNWSVYPKKEHYQISTLYGKESFITEWSVPILNTFDQNLDYDFVVDWS